MRMRSFMYWSRVVAIGIVLGVGLQFAQAWTTPTASAPGGNVDGPLNQGAVDQLKLGGLALGGNVSSHRVRINDNDEVVGQPCPGIGWLATNSAGVLLSCQSGTWQQAMGTVNAWDTTSMVSVYYDPGHPVGPYRFCMFQRESGSSARFLVRSASGIPGKYMWNTGGNNSYFWCIP